MIGVVTVTVAVASLAVVHGVVTVKVIAVDTRSSARFPAVVTGLGVLSRWWMAYTALPRELHCHGELLVEHPSEIDQCEHEQEQQRQHEGELNSRCAPLGPMSGHRFAPIP